MEFRRRAVVAMAVLAGVLLGAGSVFLDQHIRSGSNSALESGSRIIPCDFARLDERVLTERTLEKMILEIDAVGRACVRLTPGDRARELGFKGEDPAASVMIDLKPGGTLASGSVEAIARLVANGMKGLRPHRVFIMDSEGRSYGERRGS